MRIGIDARIAHYTGGGISEYTIHLAKALAQLSQEDEFVLLQSRKDRRHLVHGPHVHRVSIWTPSHNRFEQQFLRMELPRAASALISCTVPTSSRRSNSTPSNRSSPFMIWLSCVGPTS